MDGASITRLRWRLHGAWMWPSFVVLTLLDGVIVHWRPLAGDSESPVGGWLIGVFLSLVGFVVLAPLIGVVLRRLRGDMPKIVARDYAGTIVTATVTAILLAAGLAHHASVTADQRTLEDATARAEAFIGTHAPEGFQTNLRSVSTYVIQAGVMYRTCVSNTAQTKTYCVIVRPKMPFADSVRFAGYEPNSVLSQGTG
jgi:hypothetical protein